MTLFLGVTAGTRVLMCTPVELSKPADLVEAFDTQHFHHFYGGWLHQPCITHGLKLRDTISIWDRLFTNAENFFTAALIFRPKFSAYRG